MTVSVGTNVVSNKMKTRVYSVAANVKIRNICAFPSMWRRVFSQVRDSLDRWHWLAASLSDKITLLELIAVLIRSFPGGSVVKNPPADAEDLVPSLVREDPTCHMGTEPVRTSTEPVPCSLALQIGKPLQLETSLHTPRKTQHSQK